MYDPTTSLNCDFIIMWKTFTTAQDKKEGEGQNLMSFTCFCFYFSFWRRIRVHLCFVYSPNVYSLMMKNSLDWFSFSGLSRLQLQYKSIAISSPHFSFVIHFISFLWERMKFVLPKQCDVKKNKLRVEFVDWKTRTMS